MQMISAGDLVVPKLKWGIETLLLWSDSNSPSEVVVEVKKDEILTVIKIEEFKNSQLANVQSEWKKNVCLLLCSNGRTGWTGAGWIKKLPSRSRSNYKPIGNKR